MRADHRPRSQDLCLSADELAEALEHIKSLRAKPVEQRQPVLIEAKNE
jgi:hypothetical protein